MATDEHEHRDTGYEQDAAHPDDSRQEHRVAMGQAAFKVQFGRTKWQV